MANLVGSYFEQHGIKVIISTRTNADVFNIASRITSYTHEKQANGGDWSASISIGASWSEIDNWLYTGVGSWVNVYNATGQKIWSGVVNKITISLSNSTIEIGELMNLANRVSATYTPINYNVTPPVVGTATETTIAENTDSQSRYGILEKIVNAGQCTHAEAQTARNLYLKEYAYPQVTGTFSVSTSQGEPVSITIDCVGLAYYGLKSFIYNDFTTGAQSLSDKVKAIYTAEVQVNNVQFGEPPAPSAGVNLNEIQDNAYLVSRQETKNRYAWDILLSCANIGDASDNRWITGVRSDGLAYYRPAGTTITYEYKLSRERQEIYYYNRQMPVMPYDVQAGYWLRVIDLSTSRMPTSNIYAEPRDIFLESVRYTAPYSLELSGNRLHKTSQLLAKLTNSGGSQ